MAHIESINITHAVLEGEWAGSVGATGIDKRPVSGRLRLVGNAVEGDRILDTNSHGGFHKAVYAYADEDRKWWESELGINISNGSFGENLTTLGVDVTNALIGEKWKIGSTLLEVSEPRIPCRVFAGFWQRPTLIKDFTTAARPGAYLRIIEEGEVGAGDLIEIISKPKHGITIRDLFRAKSGERSKMAKIATLPELSDAYREWAKKILIANQN